MANTTQNVSVISAIFAGDFSPEATLRTLSNMHFIAAAKVKSAAAKVLVADNQRERDLEKDDAGQLTGCDDRPNDAVPQIDGAPQPTSPTIELESAMHFLFVADTVFKDLANSMSDVDADTNRTIEFGWMVKKVPSFHDQLKAIAKEFAQYQGMREASRMRADAIKPGLTADQRKRIDAQARELECSGVVDSYQALYNILLAACSAEMHEQVAARIRDYTLDDVLELAADNDYSDTDMYKGMYQQVVFFRRSYDEYLARKTEGYSNNVNIKPRIDLFVALLGEAHEKTIAASKAELDQKLAERQARAAKAKALIGLVANDPAPAAAPTESAEPVATPKKGGRRVAA